MIAARQWLFVRRYHLVHIQLPDRCASFYDTDGDTYSR